MGLACSQVSFLCLTARKADCEYGIATDTAQKSALAREQSELSREYYSKMKSKDIAYYANGKYNKINYNYLMGYDQNWMPINNGSMPLKTRNSMILTDYKGLVVLSDKYAEAIRNVLGNSAMDAFGRGSTFSNSDIAAIIADLLKDTSGLTKDDIQTIINGGMAEATSSSHFVNQNSGQTTGTGVSDASEQYTEKMKNIVAFYYGIFSAAAANGWTTEYNHELATNKDYVSDALVSGTFQLADIDDHGNYIPDTSLNYFLTAGYVIENTSSDKREEINAWYEAEKEAIAEKENWLDIDIQDLSAELEMINTQLKSLQSYIDDAMDVFNWGSK